MLLYFFVFPCAQTALSAVACTDTRQYDSSRGSIDGVISELYLNLHPWRACDSTWRRSILPPAIVGVILWFLVFPLLTTLLYRYLRRRLTTMMDPAVWLLCADLFTPYRRSHWYYEQILIGRRLALVACVTLIPADPLYLPLMLFTLIQVSALIQHRMKPYASRWMNRAELASRYLLLLNYITALILHQSSSSSGGGGDDEGRSGGVDVWTVILFLANLLVLIGGLFVSVQSKLLGMVAIVRRRVVEWCGDDEPSDRDVVRTMRDSNEEPTDDVNSKRLAP
jgi:hypothetical protein